MLRSVFLAALITLVMPALAQSGPPYTGTAIVIVETEPDVGADTLRFIGVPAGLLPLRMNRADSLVTSGLAAGSYRTTLAPLSASLQAQGYELAAIQCDDGASSRPSHADLATRTATFNVETGETVTCVFQLSAGSCICPTEGRWVIDNHAGSMNCQGPVPISMPLRPVTVRGTLDIRDNCATIYTEGMDEGMASITFHRTPSCGYRGVVNQEQGGIPMEIVFTWTVENEDWITGRLDSTVSQQGMTCVMQRTLELRHEN